MDYLIPANTKKSQLFFGIYNKFDLILVSSGVALTLLLMLFMDVSNLKIAIITILPGSITVFLTFPIPNYHNVLTIIINVITFFTTRQDFVWKGWCVEDDETEEEI